MRTPWRVLVGVLVAAAIGALAAPALAAQNTIWAECWVGNQPTACDSPPASGWWAVPVTVIWHATGEGTPSAPNDVSPCKIDTQYSYSAYSGRLSCTASWANGDTNTDGFAFHVEGTAPAAQAIPARPPDRNGWYNHPVSISFTGSAFSGIALCSDPLTYAGRSTSNVTVSGSCTDNAGKTASASISFKYDGTPPKITGAIASRSPDYHGWYTRAVSFTFRGTDALSGIASCQTKTFSGSSSGSVVGGCWDGAGNYAGMALPVRFLHVVTAPRGHVPFAPVLLRWRGSRGASYYNVQVYRGTHKLLSAWPARASLFLARSWRFSGKRFKLKPGTYRWYVWPGYGSRSADSYGRMAVSATFTVA